MYTNAPLLFLNPDFHPGVNITVRKGAKWFGRLNVGDIVEIQTTPSEDEGPADVVGYGHHMILGVVFYDTLEEITENLEDLLKFQHDPACRTASGLADELESIYGTNDDDEGFTVLVFYYSPPLSVRID